MNNNYKKVSFFVLFFALMNNVLAPATAAIPQLGINDGDSFDFTVEKYAGESGYEIEGAIVAEGEQFTVTFSDTTLTGDDDGEYYIGYEVSHNNQVFTGDTHVNAFEGLIFSTEWDMHLAEVQAELDMLEAESDDSSSTSATIIDTSTEFGVKATIEMSESFETTEFELTSELELRYERSTGVLLYSRSMETIIITIQEETETSMEEVLITRIGYSASANGDGDSALPSFEFMTIFVTFSIMFVPILLRRRD